MLWATPWREVKERIARESFHGKPFHTAKVKLRRTVTSAVRPLFIQLQKILQLYANVWGLRPTAKTC